jgi:hypothetical protein
MISDTGEQVGEIVLRVETVELGALGQGVDRSGAARGAIARSGVGGLASACARSAGRISAPSAAPFHRKLEPTLGEQFLCGGFEFTYKVRARTTTLRRKRSFTLVRSN